jgi:DNA adenine methylase
VLPVLKWAGGKRELLPKIHANLPQDYRSRRYHEPFLGGGAVFFWLKPKKGSINDVNGRLMNFYRVLRDEPEALISEAKKHPYNKEAYYKLRDRFNQKENTSIEEAALFLYFNKTAYNGLYRENSKGEFNVPFGSYKKPTIVHERRLLQANRVLKGIEIVNDDFSYVLNVAREGDICYLDPPYQPISKTSNFTDYSKDGFDFSDQQRLQDMCLELHEMGVIFVLSNSYSDPVRELYEGIEVFRVEKVSAKRVISSNATTRGRINEILVTNFTK